MLQNVVSFIFSVTRKVPGAPNDAHPEKSGTVGDNHPYQW
jgi:hypothetical protein